MKFSSKLSVIFFSGTFVSLLNSSAIEELAKDKLVQMINTENGEIADGPVVIEWQSSSQKSNKKDYRFTHYFVSCMKNEPVDKCHVYQHFYNSFRDFLDLNAKTNVSPVAGEPATELKEALENKIQAAKDERNKQLY